MAPKLTCKTELRYFLEDKQVIFHNEICSEGLATNKISIGDTEVSETTIKDRVLSGECSIDGITCGYTYIYNQEGTTIDLKKINENISIDESVSQISKIKNSKDFFKAKIDGLLVITNSPQFIVSPSKTFTVYKEITLNDDGNTFIYTIRQNYTGDGHTSEMVSEEEKYQINNEYVIVTSDSKDGNTQENISSFIKQLEPLKELLKTSPKSYKNLKIETQLNNTKKTIR